LFIAGSPCNLLARLAPLRSWDNWFNKPSAAPSAIAHYLKQILLPPLKQLKCTTPALQDTLFA
jgi:hypothetical protein